MGAATLTPVDRRVAIEGLCLDCPTFVIAPADRPEMTHEFFAQVMNGAASRFRGVSTGPGASSIELYWSTMLVDCVDDHALGRLCARACMLASAHDAPPESYVWIFDGNDWAALYVEKCDELGEQPAAPRSGR